jgi:phage-related protein
MVLLEIKNDRYQVLAVCTDSGKCPLAKLLKEQMRKLQQDTIRMLDLLENVAKDGPPEWGEVTEKLPKKKFHYVEGDIKQFREGRIRILWFRGAGRTVICSNAFVKMTRSTPDDEKEKAQEAFLKYFEDLKNGKIRIFKSPIEIQKAKEKGKLL